MEVVKHKSSNVTLSPPQELKDGPFKDVKVAHGTKTKQRGLDCVKTYWRPTEVELANLLAGHYVVLTIYGEKCPPASVMVEA